MGNPPPLISVIIAVYNEEAFLAQTLNQILEQNYPKDCYEVLLVDGMSTDNTLKIAESFQDRFHSLRIFSNPKQLAGSSRNPVPACSQSNRRTSEAGIIGDCQSPVKRDCFVGGFGDVPINFDQQDEILELDVGAIIVATGRK